MNLDPVFAAFLKNHGGHYQTGAHLGGHYTAPAGTSWSHLGGSQAGGVPNTTGHTVPGLNDGSGGPDYKALIESDPIFKQTQAELAAQGIQNAAQRAEMIQRALIGYGKVPDFGGNSLSKDALGYLNTDVTSLTKDLAQKNTDAGLSLVARLLDQHNRAQTGIQDNLAARGIFRSGALPSQIGREGLAYKQAGFDAQNSLLDTITGTINGFVTQQQAIQAELRAAMEAASGRAYQNGSGGWDPLAGHTDKTHTAAPPRARVPNPWKPGHYGGV